MHTFRKGEYWKSEDAVVLIISSDRWIVSYIDVITGEKRAFYSESSFALNLKLLNRLEAALYSLPLKRKGER